MTTVTHVLLLQNLTCSPSLCFVINQTIRKRKVAFFTAFLIFLTGACAFAGENVLISRGTLEEASDAEVSNDVGRFLEGTNIASLSIEDYENREEVTVINRGKEYIFWIHFDPPICDDYYNEMAVFKNGRQVFYKDWEGQNDGDCNISGAGIVIEVPDSAPLGNYTWGARIHIILPISQ